MDTNICIYSLKGTHHSIYERMQTVSPKMIKVPSIVCAELFFGAEKSKRKKKTLAAIEKFLSPFEIVPFCGAAARQYAIFRNTLEKKGRPVGPNDLVVAATVAANGGVLITHNTKEFSRIKSLRLEDWTSA